MLNRSKKKSKVDYKTVLHKMRNSYFASRACMYASEADAIEHALRCGNIKDRKTLLMLADYDFTVEVPAV